MFQAAETNRAACLVQPAFSVRKRALKIQKPDAKRDISALRAQRPLRILPVRRALIVPKIVLLRCPVHKDSTARTPPSPKFQRSAVMVSIAERARHSRILLICRQVSPVLMASSVVRPRTTGLRNRAEKAHFPHPPRARARMCASPVVPVSSALEWRSSGPTNARRASYVSTEARYPVYLFYAV